MPTDVQLDGLWAGFCRDGARKGESVTIVTEEFTSSEDGESFIRRLENGPDLILKLLPNGQWINRSRIDHLLIIFHKDMRASVFIDELSPVLQIRSRGKTIAGQGVTSDHIADIESFDVGVRIPDNAGVMLMFSVGWRKGLYFDFGPLAGEPRNISLDHLFGQFYARVAFQNFFSISDDGWHSILRQKWFPFIGLSHNVRSEMIEHVRAGWEIDELTGRIVDEVKAKAPDFLTDWERHRAYNDHLPILRRAVERFLDNDFISCTGLLFPRIEGLMRTNHVASGCTTGFGQAALAASAIGPKIERKTSLLLPQRFFEFLKSVYFANFAPTDASIDTSRNSVGHGVASAEKFDQKSAVIALLVTHQLLFFFDSSAARPVSAGTP